MSAVMDPCGCAVDMLREGSTSVTWMRFSPDDPTLTRVRWYNCAPGAPALPYPSAFCSTIWESNNVYGPDVVGEVANRRYWIRSEIPRGTDYHPTGRPEWWLNGVPINVANAIYAGKLPAPTYVCGMPTWPVVLRSFGGSPAVPAFRLALRAGIAVPVGGGLGAVAGLIGLEGLAVRSAASVAVSGAFTLDAIGNALGGAAAGLDAIGGMAAAGSPGSPLGAVANVSGGTAFALDGLVLLQQANGGSPGAHAGFDSPDALTVASAGAFRTATASGLSGIVDLFSSAAPSLNATANVNTGGSSGSGIAPVGGFSAERVYFAPTAVSVSGSSATAVDVGFTLPSGATGANLYRGTSSGGPYSLIGSNVSSPYHDSPLTAGTTYYYKLASVNAGGTEGPQSSPYVGIAPPTSPTTGTITSSSVTVSWTPSGGATGTSVYRATVTGGPYTRVATNVASPYVDSGLASATTYFYRLASVSAPGIEGTYTAEFSATTASSGPTFRASSSGDVSISAGGTFTVSKPVGTQSTDLLILAISNNSFTNISTGPAGWTRLNHAEATDFTNHVNVTLWWAAGSVAALTFTDPNFFGTIGYGWVCGAFVGCNTGTQGGSNNTATSTAATTVTAPALPSIHGSDMECVALGAHNAGTWTATGFSVIQNAGVNQDATLAYNLATANSGGNMPAVVCTNSASATGQVQGCVNAQIVYP